MKIRKLWRGLGTSVVCTSLAACGSDSSPTLPTTQVAAPAPPAPVTTVVSQGSFPGLSVNAGFATNPFTTSAAGRLDVTVDWTFARNDVDAYLIRGACGPAQFNAGQCDFVAKSESTVKPEKFSVASLAAGTYVLLIINWGPDSESLSYQAVLTTGAAVAGGTSRERAAPGKSGVQSIVGR